MTISCTAVVPDKRKQKKLIASLNDLGITPEVHAQTVIGEWQGVNKCMLQNMVNLFEPFNQHSVYYSTMSQEGGGPEVISTSPYGGFVRLGIDNR